PRVNVPAFLIAFGTIRIGLGAWASAIWPALAACLAMSGTVLALRAAMPGALPTPVEAALSVATGGLVYAAVLWGFFRRRVRAVVDFLRLIRGSALGGPRRWRPLARSAGAFPAALL